MYSRQLWTTVTVLALYINIEHRPTSTQLTLRRERLTSKHSQFVRNICSMAYMFTRDPNLRIGKTTSQIQIVYNIIIAYS